MTRPLEQHRIEIERNLRAWESKPLLREIYAGFYRRVIAWLDAGVPGPVVELGSGLGHLKEHLPQAFTTDLFPNPRLDLLCDAYRMPFAPGSISHLVLFDVFHHLEAPNVFLQEARRVLAPRGRIILFEPFISLSSFAIYGLLHHERVGWWKPVNLAEALPAPRGYYAAQGNATRLFFRREIPNWPAGWEIVHAEAFSAFHYLLSGGFSKPALYPQRWLKGLQQADTRLSRWPGVFGSRCLICLRKPAN